MQLGLPNRQCNHLLHRMRPCRKARNRWHPVRRQLHPAAAASHQHAEGAAAGLPQNWTEVMSWACTRFRAAVAPHIPDEAIDVARCCLLVALEEEACIEVHPELQEIVQQQTHLRPRSAAGAATWSLSRLDALAQQVYQLCDSQDPSTAPAPQLASNSPAAADKTKQTQLQNLIATLHDDVDNLPATSLDGPPTQPDIRSVDSLPTPVPQSQLPVGLFEREPLRVLTAINTVLFDWHGYGPSNRYGNPQDSHLSAVLEGGLGCSPALSILYMQVAARLGIRLAARPLEAGRYWVLWPADNPYLLQSMQPSLTTMNPSSSNQAAAGDDAPDVAAQRALVIDPYGQGSLLAAGEVSELFDVPLSALWVPASSRELLACLLAEVRDAHWARAVGCSAAPGTMLPLTLNTALCATVQQSQRAMPVPTSLNMHAIQRSVAAAEKATWLLPYDSRAQLMFALLLYFARRWDDCWLELGLLLERAAAAQASGGAASTETSEAHASITVAEDAMQPNDGVRACSSKQDPSIGPTACEGSVLLQTSSDGQDSVPSRHTHTSPCALDPADLDMVRLLQEKVRLMLGIQ